MCLAVTATKDINQVLKQLRSWENHQQYYRLVHISAAERLCQAKVCTENKPKNSESGSAVKPFSDRKVSPKAEHWKTLSYKKAVKDIIGYYLKKNYAIFEDGSQQVYSLIIAEIHVCISNAQLGYIYLNFCSVICNSGLEYVQRMRKGQSNRLCNLRCLYTLILLKCWNLVTFFFLLFFLKDMQLHAPLYFSYGCPLPVSLYITA